MENEPNIPADKPEEKKSWCCGGKGKGKNMKAGGGMPCGGAYGLAFLGAAVYFVQQAETFWQGVVAIGKAIIWPAILVYHLLGFLNL